MNRLFCHTTGSARCRQTPRYGLRTLACTLLGASTAVAIAQTGPTSAPILSSDTDPTLLAAASTRQPAIAGVSSSERPSAALPDAPEPQFLPITPASPRKPGEAPVTPLRSKYIPAGWKAQPLSYGATVKMGLTDLYSVGSIGSIFLAAGWEQLTNGEPNFGTDKGAFGERLGAAAIRGTSQDVFTDMVFSPLLREDSRYYQLGGGHSFMRRTFYSVTRPLVTRTNSGHQTINGGLLLGYAAAAALTPAYYPQINRNFHDTASTYGGSIGGAALGSFVSEFTDGIFRSLHLRHSVE